MYDELTKLCDNVSPSETENVIQRLDAASCEWIIMAIKVYEIVRQEF